jgi:hypothetical protein
MEDEPPILDRNGYERLTALERRVLRSPAPIAWMIGAYVGLAVVVMGALLLFGAISREDVQLKGILVTTAGALFSAACVVMAQLVLRRRLARLTCPNCRATLAWRVADLDEGERARSLRKQVVIAGRCYRAPTSEAVEGPWVRVMKEVWACEQCRIFVDPSIPHERQCTAEELARLRQEA